MTYIFEYVPRDTVIHRMSPLTKLVMLICMSILISLYWDPRFLAILAIVVAVIYVSSKTPPKWLLITIPFGAFSFFYSSVLGFMQSARSFTVLGDLAEVVLFQVGPYYLFGIQIGPIQLVYGGFLWTLAVVLRMVINLALMFSFIYSTSLNDLVKSLTRLKVPYQVIYILIVALKFVPEIFREFTLTSLAQALRGWKLKSRNPVKVFRMAAPIVNPFTRRIIMYVDKLTLTVQIRGFSGRNVKYPWHIQFSTLDWTISLLFIIGTTYALYLLFFFGIGAI